MIRYLGRYTHRVGTSNQRLVCMDDEGVTFRTKEGKTVTLGPEAFPGRFLQHVLQAGFVKIRHYGLMASSNAATKLAVARTLLEAATAVSIEDYLDRYQVGGKPSDAERLYAGLWSEEPNRGVSGFMNQFRPEVEPGSFSLIEFAVGCPAEGPVQEQIGVVISVDKVNPFGRNRQALTDGEPRLHIEYGRQKYGQIKYDWDSSDGAFKPNPIRHLYHPGQKVPVSTPGGTQVEHLIAIFQVPTGDWWIAYNHELLGYYPASLFTMLNGGACISAWYGEVARRKPASPTGPPKTAMGSGMFAEAGLGSAASVRNPRYYDLLWFGFEPRDDGSNDMTPNVPSCYIRTRLRDGLAPGDRISFLGGHGDKDRGCTWPSP